ncbi:MAG: TonB-dependent receptor [Kiritimatiellaeota bacterium]|nr:TonB-dependent receptor [Kiritimatiellota bacterium]
MNGTGRMFGKWRLSAVAVWCVGAAAVHAQNPGGEETAALPEMVVTAAPGSRDVNTVPANVTVITAKDIAETSARTVPDVLKYSAGVNVADWGGNGRTSDVDIRGFGETAGSNVLVLVDGRRVNAPDLSKTDWTTIPLERIERIEIVRGGAGVLYGDNATAGVINIITKKGRGKPILVSDTHVGSNSEFGQRLSLSGGWGALGYSLDGSYFGTKGHRDNSDFRNRSAGLQLSFDPESWYDFDFSAGVKKDSYGLPGSVTPAQDPESSNSPADNAESTDWYLHFAPTLQLCIPGELILQADYRRRDQHSVFGGYPYDTRLREYSFAPAYAVNFETGRLAHRVQAGLAYTAGDVHVIRAMDWSVWPPVPDTKSDDKYRREVGYFVYDRIKLDSDKLFLDLGCRRSRIKFTYDRHDNQTWDETAARAGLTYAYAPGSKLFAALDKSYRSQLLDEFAGPWWAGGLPIAPQTTRHWQAGVRHRFGSRLTAAATLFQIDTDNEIFFDPATFQNTSYDKTRRRGVELEVLADPTDRLHLFANFTWLNPELKDGAYDGNRIPGVAKQSASAGATVTVPGGLVWDVRGRWVKKHPMISDWSNGKPVADGYIVFDTKVSFTCPKHKWLTVYAGVNNLLDEDYAEYAVASAFDNNLHLYPSPGRTFVAGVKVRKEF